ncbi:MAG UNVERIFIED_CONTAM: EscU/YscU/HrcU family type III secretion system export apparatus switch protein [Rickettsiaceae bacterium]|jgi:flagellar biosynthesis protein
MSHNYAINLLLMNYYTKNNRNKVQTAIAIKYDQDIDSQPRIVATGKGTIAEKILAIASQENIPIAEDKELAEILSFIELGAAIPIEAYSLLAKVLEHIYKYKE